MAITFLEKSSKLPCLECEHQIQTSTLTDEMSFKLIIFAYLDISSNTSPLVSSSSYATMISKLL